MVNLISQVVICICNIIGAHIRWMQALKFIFFTIVFAAISLFLLSYSLTRESATLNLGKTANRSSSSTPSSTILVLGALLELDCGVGEAINDYRMEKVIAFEREKNQEDSLMRLLMIPKNNTNSYGINT